jgi:hypothetical protein
MISIQTADGDLVKVLQNISNTEFGFHKLFGFTSSEKANKRLESRKRQAYDYTNDEWNFKFNIKSSKDSWELTNLIGCEARKMGDGWSLDTPQGIFKLVNAAGGKVSPILEDTEDSNEWMSKLVEYFLIFTFVMIPILYFMTAEPTPEEIKEDVKAPITVKIVQKADVVKIKQNNPNLKVKPLTKAQKSKRAVARNLGFLGMVGSKDLSKVTGGVPQKLKAATAGAGKGGDAGSGGELLVGLGKGLKKTTVGNTGVQGLGGIGTKGAGGGKGGYGNTMVASGSGKGISAIAVSNSNMAIEGGLSRYAINATIAKYLSQVRRCYETQLKFNPNLQGLVEVSFMINGTGSLDFSKINRTTLKNPAAEKCITTKMMGWQFPKPKGGVKVPVKYPFMLRPVGR